MRVVAEELEFPEGPVCLPDGSGNCIELGSPMDGDEGTFNDSPCPLTAHYLCERSPAGSPP